MKELAKKRQVWGGGSSAQLCGAIPSQEVGTLPGTQNTVPAGDCLLSPGEMKENGGE